MEPLAAQLMAPASTACHGPGALSQCEVTLALKMLTFTGGKTQLTTVTHCEAGRRLMEGLDGRGSRQVREGSVGRH